MTTRAASWTSVVCGARVHAVRVDGATTMCGIWFAPALLRPAYRHEVDCPRCLEVVS